MEFKVSVIIAVYNGEKYLDECLNSVISLTEVGEIICVDDKSTDRSKNIIKSWGNRDYRIVYLENYGQKGCGPARNVGIRYAKFNYIAFLDADDTFDSSRFLKESEIFVDDNVDGIANSIIRMGNDIKYELIGPKSKLFPIRYIDFLNGYNFSLIGTTLRKGVFEKIGYFDEKYLIAQDQIFIFQLLNNVNILTGNDKSPVAYYRVHSSNSTNNFQNVHMYGSMVWKNIFWQCIHKSLGLQCAYITFAKYIEHEYNLLFLHQTKAKKMIKLFLLPFFIFNLVKK